LQDHHLVYPEDLQAANFTGDYLDRYGANVRNLEALEALHSITTQVMR
jgi:hypothetical protein